MKKTLLLSVLMLCLGFVAKADVVKFTATECSIRTYDENRDRWSDWSKWSDCRVLVVIDGDQERITIYSDKMQEYDIYAIESEDEKDRDGGITDKFRCVDQDGVRCSMRLRKQKNGVLQLYIDYLDVMWVYNLESR